MTLRVGIVLGDLDSSGAPWQYISTLVNQLSPDPDTTVYGLHTGGRRDAISESVRLVDFSSKHPLPTWHRASQEHDLDLFHLNGMPRFGHWPAFRSDIPVVVTTHGVPQWRQLSQKYRPSRKFNIEYQWRDRVGKYTIDAVFAISDAVRNVYENEAGYDSENVITTYEGVADEYFESPPISHPDNLPQRYLLHVSDSSGRSAQRKNVRTILSAINILDEHGKQTPSLVVAGSGWEKKLFNSVKQMGLSEHIHFTGYVGDKYLLALYDNADIFVFPSLSEGFGLPNVEAMARGTPVISSDRFAIPEVVDGGGILLDDPLDEKELADAITRLLTDDQLRAELVSNGQTQAQKFTWDNHVDTVKHAYRTVLKDS